MDKKALNIFFKMESNRSKMFQFLSDFDSEKFNEMPDRDWSVNQNIQHLLISEKSTVQYLGKKILAADELENTGIRNKWNWFLLRTAFSLPFKYKAPKIVNPKSEVFKFTELMYEWDTCRRDLQGFINTFPEAYRNKNIFKHPYSGRANLNMCIDFLDFHSARHFNQIKRTIKKI